MAETRTVAGVGVAVVALALAIATWRSVPAPTATGPEPAAGLQPPAVALSPPPTPSDTPAHFRPLLGEWLRPDGGYVLVVHAIRADGEAAVAYLNPRPIRVARAEARRKGDVVSLFVEFDDVNYRGSTYSLALDGDSGQLEGSTSRRPSGSSSTSCLSGPADLALCRERRPEVYLDAYVEAGVAQVTLYLDEATKQRVRKAAKAAGLSQSRWLAELVRRGADAEWPAEVRELAGAWPDFPEAEELRRGSGRDARRERL